jgi:hypothetical protein
VVGSSNPIRSTTQSFEPADFPETAKEPAIGGSCGCVSVSAETIPGLKAILGGLSLGGGIPFPRCRSYGAWS